MRVLNYNIEYGGYEKKISIKKYIRLIKNNNIDIMIICEPNLPTIKDTYDIDGKILVDYSDYGNNSMEMLAKKIGFNYITTYDKCITIITHYDIKKEPNSNFVFDIMVNGRIIKIIPIHLIDYPFTFYSLHNIPYQETPLKIDNKEDVVKLSYSTKSKDIEKIIDYVKMNPGEKIIIAGDFNEPSHLDDPLNEWIVSKKFEDIGMIDSYRHMNKTIIRDKLGYNIDGASCCNIPADFEYELKSENSSNSEPSSRIDFIYTKNLDIVSSNVLKQYASYSDHLPLLTVVDFHKTINYRMKYMKYKIKYLKLIQLIDFIV